MQTPILSCDAHITEPEELWSSQLPEDERYRVPMCSRVQDTKLFKVNGKIISISDEYFRYYRDGELVAVNPRELPGDVVAEVIERDSSETYLRDMAQDGVYAETLHPNVGLLIYDIGDPAFAMRCAQIYNDYAHERFDSERLIPNAVIPVGDIGAAVREIERTAALGFRGIELPINAPVGAPYYLSSYEPIWAVANAHHLPVVFHAGTGFDSDFVLRSVEWPTNPSDRPAAGLAMRTTTPGFQGAAAACGVTVPALISAGICERYPDQHFLFIETGARWLALLMDNMDVAWTGTTVSRDVQRTFFDANGSPELQYPVEYLDAQWRLPLLPSEYVKRQMHFGLIDDHIALRNRHLTGVEALMWGNDYPHYEGTWPKSQAAIDAMANRYDLTDAERSAIFGGTLASIYNVPLPTPAEEAVSG
jgi:predicted TIM-barrel fold metal-dependent hydrolase